jgi:cbb3-type cytochrome oxidase subunit 3
MKSVYNPTKKKKIINHNSQNNLILNDEIEKNLNKKSLGC